MTIQMASYSSPLGSYRRNVLLLLCKLAIAGVLITSCAERAPKEPDLPKRPDRWVASVKLDSVSKLKYVGKTKDYLLTDATTIKELDLKRTIRVGDELEGIRIGAIRCSFHWRDASYGGEQYMWRGRWGCQAGRNEQEVLSAVSEDGTKRFEYLYINPVRLDDD